MKHPLIPIASAVLAATISMAAHAQQAERVETRISLLAIGDPPQPRYEIRDDRRHLLETAAADYPPPQVVVREKNGEREAFKTVPLGLNTPTGYVTYRGERNLVLLREDEEGGRSEFASLTIPPLRNDLTIFLMRNRRSNSWAEAPDARFFDNGLEAFPNDSVRLINLSTVPIRAQVNDGRVRQINAGQSAVVRIPRSDQGVLSYRVAAVVEDEVFPLIDTATTTMPDTRFNLITYNSDGSDARMPVNITQYFERPQQADSE
jgi:hypothetical protein